MTKITIPTFLVDHKKIKRNIEKMVDKANQNHLIFRPHFKTHQSIEVGKFFKDYDVSKITVSSVDMAILFANAGWNDITVAFPVNILEIEKINTLAKKITLNLLVESPESTAFLARNLKYPVNLFIKIDTGYGRTGVDFKNKELVDGILRESDQSGFLNFMGFLTHAGHSYQTRSKNQIEQVYSDSAQKITDLTSDYRKVYPEIIASYGDTPTCSVMEKFDGLDEIRPGNFVYYDVMQLEIGSCQPSEIAVAIACPVVAKHSERNELVIYGGAVHLSKESIETQSNGKIYGLVAENQGAFWGNPIPGAYIKQLSQEHGIITGTPEFIESVKPGEILRILPVHSCLTANLLKQNTIII